MKRLTGARKSNAWGSREAIPGFLGEEPTASPLSEVWFGDHPRGMTMAGEIPLRDLIAQNPEYVLGEGLIYSFGRSLPYLFKLIAPAESLSLQVHPTKEIAREGFIREDVLEVPLDSPQRTYRDMNHKPEMLYALTDFEALVGFRVPNKARRLLKGLESPLAVAISKRLKLATVRGGLRSLVSWLLDGDSLATPENIATFAEECRSRCEAGTSPSRRADSLVVNLYEQYRGDPGVVVAFLMNPVSLRPGETVYIAPRQIHAYQSGLGVEVMASSDNVIRAGLTPKFVDSVQLVEIAEFSALPPVRVGAEHPNETTDRFLAPVQEFALEVTTVDSDEEWVRVPGEGPRVVLCARGGVTVKSGKATPNADLGGQADTLARGEAVFVSACEGKLFACGHGQVIQCSVP